MDKKIILVCTILFFLTARSAVADVGMGLAPNIINMTIDAGERHSTNLILYNPYNISYYAFLNVECNNCNYNITFLGHNLIEVSEDISQFIEINQLNVFLKNNTPVQEGENIFPIIKSPVFVTKNIKIDFLGGLPITVKTPIIGTKNVLGKIVATSDGLGTNISIAIDCILTIRGVPMIFFILYVLTAVLIATLILRRFLFKH